MTGPPQDAPPDEPPGEPPDEGGDRACWLHRVCDACGAVQDGPPHPVCPRCGAEAEPA